MEKPDCRWRIKAESERMLTRVAQDAERALRAVEQAEGLLDDEAVAEARQLLRDLIGQDFDVDAMSTTMVSRGFIAAPRQGRIISTVDPEMRHGRKSESQRFDGFKLHVAVTNSGEPLITAVDVGDASAHDGAHAKELIDQQPEELRPDRILGDSAYGDPQTREDMQPRGRGAGPRAGGRGFRGPDRQARVPDRSGGRNRHLPGRSCRRDPTAGASRRRARGQLRRRPLQRLPAEASLRTLRGRPQTDDRPSRGLFQARRTALQDADTEEHLRRTRPRIERFIGVLANRYGARKNRYIGSTKRTGTGQLGRRAGQPQPDRPSPGCPDRIERAWSVPVDLADLNPLPASPIPV